MEKGTAPAKPQKQERPPGRGKVTPRVKVEEKVIRIEVPPGSVFKGHEPFLVQDIVLSANATCSPRERWITPDGRTILAPLPPGIAGHFGPEPRRFVLMQYHQGPSTMPRLLALPRSVGVAISKRQGTRGPTLLVLLHAIVPEPGATLQRQRRVLQPFHAEPA